MTTLNGILLTAWVAAWIGSIPQEEAKAPVRRPPASTESVSNDGVSTAVESEQAESNSVVLEAIDLRRRVRDMRKTVLGGGPSVERAEKQALSFYKRKLKSNAARMDELRTDRDAENARYRLALDATLNGRDAQAREKAARNAAELRDSIASLDSTMVELNVQRGSLGRGIASIEARIDRRKRIIEHFDSGEADDNFVYFGEDFLGPDDNGAGTDDPFEDGGFLRDLLLRDPVRARAVIFAHDPVRYWEFFPLAPPGPALRKVLGFPPADFPGRR